MSAALAWHAPRFTAWQCASGAMSDRERLGLPDRFHETDLQRAVAHVTTALRQAPGHVLLAMIEGAHATLPTRIAAGNLLALAGDPRIDPFAPAMCDVPGGTVWIGLDPALVDATSAELADLGIDAGWIAKEAPRHSVTLAPYRIARFPVTNAEYRAFLAETGHPGLPTSWAFRRYPAELANHPVYTVGATDADNDAAYPGGAPVADHLVQSHGTYRVARGGGFSRFRDLARTRRRHGHNPRSATYAMGFRLAESP